MEDKYFIWDEINEGIVLSRDTKIEDEKKKNKKEMKIPESKIYCPHKHLNFNFKETLNFCEQIKFRKCYQRRTPQRQMLKDVVILQDIKDLVIYMISTTISTEFLEFIHLIIVDRFLRALILYMQHYLTTWNELELKREAARKRLTNPLAGGIRVVRSQEMRILRCLIAREYADLLVACQKEAKKYHHVGSGKISYTKSKGEKDLRIFEDLIQFAHRVVWIALERKQKDLIELEIHRLFRTESFNIAARKCIVNGIDWQVPEDEYWILYGGKMFSKRKILRNSSLPYELLNIDCDYRILRIGLTNVKSPDPRIIYFENALLANEENLSRLGVKIGILGLPRMDFDLMLIPLINEDKQVAIEETPIEEDEEVDEYVSLIPVYGSDLELTISFPMDKIIPRYVGNEKIRKDSKKKWILREMKRVSSDYTVIKSTSAI
ncbi:PREDICTED: uncharacterized protein LOC105360880 [Ceratosolen solmsi marchali]|uniref:Uncharacterized protein LOC105360880 n=1 Tax=Ceratosolen solmsi marchali TaxID=326594 RepID=A0AAJ6YDR4_9HYME|nr:PREDICTED: uncharacterized protein LOC105360880 [Ceratosolen solmsi marchali]